MAVESVPGDPMTKAQFRVANCIAKFSALWERPPTRQEIADILGFASPNASQCHIDLLKKKGYIRTEPGKSRAIRLTPDCYREIRRIEDCKGADI